MRIQHLGMNVYKNKKGEICYSHIGLKKRYTKTYQDVNEVEGFGNTGAFMLTPLTLWNKIGGLNEKYEVCFEDVEYNLECIKRGRKNITINNCSAYHRESSTRGKDTNKSDIKRIREFTEEMNFDFL